MRAPAERSPQAVEPRALPRVLQAFLETETAGSIVLLLAALVALVWANSPWQDGYAALWETDIVFAVGDVERSLDLRHFVNEALMPVFFFVVGLEIKRELVSGELRTWQRAALPAIAAAGGMAVPALLYTALNAGGPGASGWGVPMATDIAFTLGVLALLGRRVPSALKVFLLSLAIVDDIGAILVIALAYSDDIRVVPLIVALGTLVAMAALRGARMHWMPLFVALAVVVWAAVYESGMHATIAGVVLGLLAPGSATRRLEVLLHPLSSFVIVPIFALANAGIVLRSDALDAPGAARVTLGVVVGLVAGKVIGISAFSWLAVRLRIGALPTDIRAVHVVGVSAVAGIGFTVSLFIGGLAFDDPRLERAAQIGVLAASVLAAGLGLLVLRASDRRQQIP